MKFPTVGNRSALPVALVGLLPAAVLPLTVSIASTHISIQHMTGPQLPKIPDLIHRQQLEAMHYIAKLKESADKLGIGFIGGFIAPDGEKFVMSNMDDDDQQLILPEHLK